MEEHPRMTTMERIGSGTLDRIAGWLGGEAESLLSYTCKGISKDQLMLPGPDHVDRAWGASDRKAPVLVNLQRLYGTGRLGNTGYMSILPVDQGVEHSAAASFAPNLDYMAPEKIVEFALEAECNAVASTVGVLGAVARKYAHRIPFIAKINHNELLTYPNKFSQILFGSVQQAWEMGAAAVGATVYFGSEDSDREIVEIAEAFQHAHELGLATVLWAYTRNDAFKKDGVDYHTSADLTGQANHLAATMQADIVKQKQATNNGGYNALKFGKTSPKIYGDLVADHPIDWTRWQVVNCYMGRASLINSGGESKGADDLAQAVRTAVINKRAGGSGLISGRKAFQRPRKEGVELLRAIQDVYLCDEVTIA
jgi:class I fructose-bisphosphate aldolase